jgi:hypothetical protein
MIGSGVFEVEINGETIGFEFGMLASSYTEEESQLPILAVFQQIGTGHGSRHVLSYFYGGARAYNEFREIKKKVTVPMVSKWIEAIGLEKAMEIYIKSIDSYLPKNGQAPKETAGHLE